MLRKTRYLQDGHFLLHNDWLLFDDWNDLVNGLWDWYWDVLVYWIEVRLWNLLIASVVYKRLRPVHGDGVRDVARG